MHKNDIYIFILIFSKINLKYKSYYIQLCKSNCIFFCIALRNKMYPLLWCLVLDKFRNRYYYVGPPLWEVRSASLLLYSFRSCGYILGMISRVCQWPFETYAFIASCFTFRKNIVSVNLRAVAALACHHRCFIRLILAGKIVDSGVRCIRRASAFRRLRVSRYVNFFQSYCAPLLCNGKNVDFTHMRSLRYTYVATFREQHIFVYLRIFICCIKMQTEADFKLNTVKKHWLFKT